MIQCARCAASNQPSSKFCLSCGAPLPAASAGAAGPSASGAQPAPPPPPAGPGGLPPLPPVAWGPPGYGPPPGPPPGPGGWPGNQPAPSPPAPPAAPPDDRHRFGSPDGLNPYGATVGPPPQQAYAPPPLGQPPPPPAGYGAPQAPPFSPPPGPSQLGNYGAPPPLVSNQNFGAPPQAPPLSPGYPPGPPPAIHNAPPPFAPSRDVNPYAPTGAPGRDESEPQRQWPPPASPSAPPQQGPGAHVGPRPGGSRPPQGSVGRDPEQLEPGAARVLAGFLVSYEGNELGAFWPIYQGTNVVGRRGAAPGLDVEIDNPTTSSRHAILYASARPARLKLEDTGSTNGTFLREQALERGKRHEIMDGDPVRFGGFLTIVKLV